MRKRRKSTAELVAEVLTTRFVGAPVILIKLIELIPAAMLRLIDLFCEHHKHEMNGRLWIRNSVRRWSQVTGLTEAQIGHALRKLAEDKLIFRTSEHNPEPNDQTLWYSVDHEVLEETVNKTSPGLTSAEILAGRFIGAPAVLIELIGFAPAVMLRQIDLFSNYHKHEMDGRRWTYNSIRSWSETTGLTVKQVRYALEEKLAKHNLIFRADQYNKNPNNHTLWYSVNQEELERLVYEKYISIPPDPPTPTSHEKAEQNRALEAFRIGSGNIE